MKRKNIKDLVNDNINIETAKRNLTKGYIAESVLEQDIKTEKQQAEIDDLAEMIELTTKGGNIKTRNDGSLSYRKGGKTKTVSPLQKSYLMDTFMGSNSYDNGEEVIPFGYHNAAGEALTTDAPIGSETAASEFYPDINYDPVGNPWHKALSERFQAPPPNLLTFDWQSAIPSTGGEFNPMHLNMLADYSYKNPSDVPRLGGRQLTNYTNQFAGTSNTAGDYDTRWKRQMIKKKYPKLSNKEINNIIKYADDNNLINNNIINPITDSKKEPAYLYSNQITPNIVNSGRNYSRRKNKKNKSYLASTLSNDDVNLNVNLDEVTVTGNRVPGELIVDANRLNDEDKVIINSDPSTLDPDGLQRYRELYGHDPNYNPNNDPNLVPVNNEIVDADNDNISDFVDIDGGTGTNKPVEGVTVPGVDDGEGEGEGGDNNKKNKKVKKGLKDLMGNLTRGDKLGLLGVGLGSLGQLGAAFGSRASDLGMDNVYADVTKEAESYLRNAIGDIEGLKRQSAANIRSRIGREPDTAMTYQQRRARELGRELKIDQAVRDSNLKYDTVQLDTQSKLAQLIAEGDKLEAAGRAMARQEEQANRDAFWSAISQAGSTAAAGLQKFGQDLNVAKVNKEIVDTLKTSNFKVVNGPNGTQVVFDGNGNYVGPLYSEDGTVNPNVVTENPVVTPEGTDGGGDGNVTTNNINTTGDGTTVNNNDAINNTYNTQGGVVKSNVNKITDIEGNDVSNINSFTISENGDLLINPDGAGYYADGQQVYGEPNYITADQYESITGEKYPEDKLTEGPAENPYKVGNKTVNMFDPTIVGKENIGPNNTPLNVNEAGIPVFESMADIPAGYDNSDYIVVKDENGVYYGYKNDKTPVTISETDDPTGEYLGNQPVEGEEIGTTAGTWVKQVGKKDKIRMYVPFAKDNENMKSILSKGDVAIQWIEPENTTANSYARGGHVSRTAKHPYLSLKIVGKV